MNVIVASNGGVYVKELEEAGIRHYSVPLHNKNIYRNSYLRYIFNFPQFPFYTLPVHIPSLS